MGSYNAVIDEEAEEFLADVSNGDARAALNAVELGVMTTDRDPSDGKIHISLQVAEECIQKRVVRYDKTGDNHYDTISAFIKSMRGSDPDAAVYYLARMLYAGEDIKFIARRIMICAAEDVGNADPQALILAVAAAFRKLRSFWRKRSPMWPRHLRAMRPVWQYLELWMQYGTRKPCLCRFICRTPIIRERRSWAMDRVISMPMIIRATM